MTLGVAFAVAGAALARADRAGDVLRRTRADAVSVAPVPLRRGADAAARLPLYRPAGPVAGNADGIFGGVPTQIPSFLLGDYDPLRPPAAAGTYYPEHFADGDIYSWQAPFDYVPVAAGTVTVDDDNGARERKRIHGDGRFR